MGSPGHGRAIVMTSGAGDGGSVARQRVTAGLLAVLGFLTLATGLYFLFSRPAMLPEDVRFTGVTSGDLPPRIIDWIQIVFRTWGGFMAGFGITLIGVASYIITASKTLLYWAIAVAVATAFGRFLLGNVAIKSDYLVPIAILFGLAVVAALCLILPRGRRSHPVAPGGVIRTGRL